MGIQIVVSAYILNNVYKIDLFIDRLRVIEITFKKTSYTNYVIHSLFLSVCVKRIEGMLYVSCVMPSIVYISLSFFALITLNYYFSFFKQESKPAGTVTK